MVNLDNSDTALKDFAQTHSAHTYKKGDVLVRPGEAPSDILFIESGKVHQLDISPNGNEIVVNVFAEPAMLSVFWLFEANENRFTYKASTDVVIRRAPRKDVQAFLLDRPKVLYETLHRVVRGLDGFITRMTYQMYGSAEKKTAIELLIETKRFHKSKKTNVTLESNVNDFTARTGLARETVSRQVAALMAKGLLTKKKSKLVVVDVAKLEEYITAV